MSKNDVEGIYRRKIVWWVLFIVYCGFIVWMTLLDRPATTSRCELRLFWALQELAAGGSEGIKGIIWYLENIALFVPFGYLLSARNLSVKVVILIGLITSFSVELIQYITAMGLAELDDLVANTIGVTLGFGLWKLLKNVVKSHRDKGW